MTAEIVAVGDELVRGIVADTNSAWIAARLAALAVPLARITVLPDDVEVVASELRAALARGARLLLTTGGLGPTADDRTLEAVARATGRPLAEDPWALEFVSSRYRFLAEAGVIESGELAPARRKMAVLPRGARPLPNSVGTAPGVAVREGATTIVSLPGVPQEMKAMWDEAVVPVLGEVYAASGFAEATVVAGCNDESVLAPIVAAVAERHPDVYVKSRAHEFAPGGGLRVTFVASGADAAGAEAELRAAVEDLGRMLGESGFGLRRP